mmetsp:Transcript_10684/g.29445  ORF Transcript_10684/g.29445 Transcript_10684/m.29445 type:complete len:493 (+) Transcript_10684:81-1559(+)
MPNRHDDSIPTQRVGLKRQVSPSPETVPTSSLSDSISVPQHEPLSRNSATNDGSSTSTRERRSRRKSSRGTDASIHDLAKMLVEREKRVVIVTGAGLSAASGVRPFRTHAGNNQLSNPQQHGVLPTTAGLWNSVIWSTATRQAFRRDPLQWYTSFWMPHFQKHETYYPNMGHYALQEVLEEFSENVTQITQNVDGLQPPSSRLIEAHGRIGLYKCLPGSDSDTDEESDDDESRQVHLGHRRKRRLIREQQSKDQKYKSDNVTTRNGNKSGVCPYSWENSLTAQQLEPRAVRKALSLRTSSSRDALNSRNDDDDSESSSDDDDDDATLKQAPTCPHCGNLVLPQALLFDEGYHSHAHYQFERMEDVLSEADVLVFCGTSFSVQLTDTALKRARDRELPVYNFNVHDSLASTPRLNVINILGPAAETLPQLMRTCRQIMEEQQQPNHQEQDTENQPQSTQVQAKRRRRPSRACVRKRVRYLQRRERQRRAMSSS